LLCNSIKPKLGVICRIDDSVVLDGLSLVDQAGSPECSSKGLNDRFTTNGINTSEEDLDSKGACRLEADPECHPPAPVVSDGVLRILLANCFGGKCFGSRPDFENQQKVENPKQVERKEERRAKQSHPTATAGLSFNTTKVKAGNAREKERSKQRKPPIWNKRKQDSAAEGSTLLGMETTEDKERGSVKCHTLCSRMFSYGKRMQAYYI
jgi:hypothetical protein